MAVAGIPDEVDDTRIGIGGEEVAGGPLDSRALVAPANLAAPRGVLFVRQREQPCVGARTLGEVAQEPVGVDPEHRDLAAAQHRLDAALAVGRVLQITEPSAELCPQLRPSGDRDPGVRRQHPPDQRLARSRRARDEYGAHQPRPRRKSALSCCAWR
jgi:hypothetical protein